MSGARRTGMPSAVSRRALFAAIGLTLALYALAWWVPLLGWLAWPLLLLSTIVHESGHGLAAMALGADVEGLRVFADGSGVAQYRASFGAASTAGVAAAGPLAPPLLAALLFVACRHAGGARVALLGLAGACGLAAMLWAGNLFALGSLVVLGAILAALGWRAGATTRQAAVAFLAIQLGLAAFARADYLFMASARTAAGPLPSDTAQIALALGLPHWVWGALLAACSLAVLVAGVRSLKPLLR